MHECSWQLYEATTEISCEKMQSEMDLEFGDKDSSHSWSCFTARNSVSLTFTKIFVWTPYERVESLGIGRSSAAVNRKATDLLKWK